MASIVQDTTVRAYMDFMRDVYSVSNDRHFSLGDMMTNIDRFIMRGLKGIRKGDEEKTVLNLLIAFSWFASFVNRFHIDIENEVWERFPGACSYCAAAPCDCGEKRPAKRQVMRGDEKDKPAILHDFQEMFETIYPAKNRSLEKAGIHLAEEMGELSESLLDYRGHHNEKTLKNVKLEAADLFSCFLGVFNSLQRDVAEASAALFRENCHVCKQAPCQCDFDFIMTFKS